MVQISVPIFKRFLGNKKPRKPHEQRIKQAIILFACTTFAWFTSKDEVTNRLTANSDYGVSIVESFVPPKNMLPGQEVNKDVYAVNTGTIDAFVKETVSGKLNYTYEGRSETFDTTNIDKYVELSAQTVTVIDGATANEAGGWLAWTDATGVDVGAVNSSRQTEDPAVEGDRWHPTKTGNYIFRRSVTGDPTNPYTYAGYHYEALEDDPDTTEEDESLNEGKYYKIWIGNDDWRAKFENATPDEAVFDISVDYKDIEAGGTDIALVNGGQGEFEGTPKIHYVVEVPVVDVVPTLTYHDATADDAAYLEAAYSVSLSASQTDLAAAQADKAAKETARDATTTDLAQKEIDYQDALGAYNSALSRYRQTKADYDYAKALTDATNDLIDAANVRKAVEAAKDAAATALQNAATKLKNDANTLLNDNTWITGIAGDSTTAGAGNFDPIGSLKLVPQAARDRITAYNNNHLDTEGNGPLDNVRKNIAAFDAKYQEIEGYATTLKGALDELAAIEAGDPKTATDPATTPTGTNFDNYTTSARVNELQGTVNTARGNLETALDEYNALYSNIVRGTTAESNLTGLDWSTNDIGDFITTFDELDLTTFNTDANDYETKYDAYKAFVDGNGTVAAADTAWETAVSTYNEAVNTAYNDYHTVIDANQPVPNYYVGYNSTTELSTPHALTDNGATLVVYNGTANTAGYSANFTGDDPATSSTTETDSPKIAEDVSWKVYTTDTEYSSNPINSTSKTAGATNNAPIIKQTVAGEDAFAPLIAADGTKLGVRAEGTTPATDGSLAKALDEAETTLGTKKTAYETAQGVYDTAQAAVDAAQANINAANADIAAAQTAVNDANNDIAASLTYDPSAIKFKITLAKPLNWTSGLGNDASAEEAAFYYNKVLGAGETSDKLIDSVTLDKSTTVNNYKTLTFDLNVDLDSAQVTYAPDQKTITTDAVVAPTFNKTATVTDQTAKTVSWT